MASTGKFNGTLLALYAGGTKIAHLTSNDMQFSHALRGATTKDSAGWEESLEGLRSASFSCEGMLAEDAAYGFEDLYSFYSGRTTLVVRFSSEVAGDKYYEGTCYLEDLSASAGTEETATFSCSLKVTGEITQGTVV